MIDTTIILPSKPKVIREDESRGVYEIEGLYPGYGHTLGNSLRRIILSSLAGTAVTSVKIAGAEHEFSTLAGVKEDVILLILNLKKIRFQMTGDEPEKLTLSVKGIKEVVAGDIETTDRVKIINKNQPVASLTDKKSDLEIELTVEKGLGYLPKEFWPKESRAIGTIFLDAVFTPISRVSYEVENMRVGERTDFNRLRLSLETDGTITPREGLEKAIRIMINQLQAVVGFREEFPEEETPTEAPLGEVARAPGEDWVKSSVEEVDLPARTVRALTEAGIKTISGLIRKRESDLLGLEGLGAKSVEEIKKLLAEHGLGLKEEA